MYLNFRAQVTCLLVSGDRAIVGGVVTGGGATGQLGTGFAVGFVDKPSPTLDEVTFMDVVIPPAVDCAAEASLFTLPTFQSLHGNMVVGDAA